MVFTVMMMVVMVLGMFGVLALPSLRGRYQQRREAERRHRQDHYQFFHILEIMLVITRIV